MSNSTAIHSMLLAALFVGAAALAPPAQAQSCNDSVPVVHSSYPADGATDVPTNAPLFIYGPALEMGSTNVTLQDASGEAVSIDVQAADGGLLIDPFLGLTPGTTYELNVSGAGGEEWSASFTTGARPAMIVQLRAPEVGVSVIEQDQGDCVVSAICVIGEVSTNRSLEVLVNGEVLSLGGGQARPAFLAGGGAIAANACIEVRLREPGGAVSERTRVCGADLGRFELEASASAPTSCAAYAVSEDDDDDESSSDSGGCALGARGAAPGGGGLALGLAALLAARWRRARGRARQGAGAIAS